MDVSGDIEPLRYEGGRFERYDFRNRMRVCSILIALARAIREAIT